MRFRHEIAVTGTAFLSYGMLLPSWLTTSVCHENMNLQKVLTLLTVGESQIPGSRISRPR